MQHSKVLFFLVALLFACNNAQSVRGIWYWTWSGSFNDGSATLAVAFSGEVDADAAISSSKSVIGHLSGSKYISLGGGNGNGAWSSGAISKISSYCKSKKFSGYQGIAFDIEEGASGLGSAFVSAFKACKSAGYKVLVTVSHSTPYGIGDGSSLMKTFFSNAGSIDYMSPQLYTSGNEGSNDFTQNGVSWSSYKPFSGKLVPSIVSANLYGSAQSYFKNLGITTVGYVQWRQSSVPAAVAASDATYQSSTSSGLEPAAIGIIVGGCVLGVVMIVVAVIVIVSANKKQLERA